MDCAVLDFLYHKEFSMKSIKFVKTLFLLCGLTLLSASCDVQPKPTDKKQKQPEEIYHDNK